MTARAAGVYLKARRLAEFGKSIALDMVNAVPHRVAIRPIVTALAGDSKMAYKYRVKAVGSSTYADAFDEMKEAVLSYINKNNCGVVYEKIDGVDRVVWRFEPFYGLVRAV